MQINASNYLMTVILLVEYITDREFLWKNIVLSQENNTKINQQIETLRKQFNDICSSPTHSGFRVVSKQSTVTIQKPETFFSTNSTLTQNTAESSLCKQVNSSISLSSLDQINKKIKAILKCICANNSHHKIEVGTFSNSIGQNQFFFFFKRIRLLQKI